MGLKGVKARSVGKTKTIVGAGAEVGRSVMRRDSDSRNPSNSIATLRRIRGLTSPMTTKLGLSTRRHSAADGIATPTHTNIARTRERLEVGLIDMNSPVEIVLAA